MDVESPSHGKNSSQSVRVASLTLTDSLQQGVHRACVGVGPYSFQLNSLCRFVVVVVARACCLWSELFWFAVGWEDSTFDMRAVTVHGAVTVHVVGCAAVARFDFVV